MRHQLVEHRAAAGNGPQLRLCFTFGYPLHRNLSTMSVDPTVKRRDRGSPTRKKGRDPMSTTEVPGRATADPSVVHVDMNLETVVIPVSDVDRAKAFYEGLGWRLDADLGAGEFRIIQFNPPGSGCSIQFGSGLTSAAPGSAANLLVVSDIETAHDDLVAHGTDAEVFHD